MTADEPLFAEATCTLLEKESWLVTSSAPSLPAAVKQLDSVDGRTAVVVIAKVAGEKLFEEISGLRGRLPDSGVCLVAERVDRTALRHAVCEAPGSFALLTRASRPTRRDLLVALQALVSGRVLLPTHELETLVTDADSEHDEWDSLSPSEVKVAELVSDGLRNRDIASRVGRSEKSVEHLVGRLYTKFGLDGDRDRRVVLTRIAIAHSQNGARPRAGAR